MVCARTYFTGLLAEAEKNRIEFENNRNDSDMRIAAWRAEVYREVLTKCVAGLRIEDVGLAVIESLLKNDDHFLYERGRRDLADEFVKLLVIPA